MATKTSMTVEEYLRGPFDGADCDFVDGELFERNMGETEHSIIQGELIRRLFLLAERAGLVVRPEIRIQTMAQRFRVADVALWRDAEACRTGIPTMAPFLAIEILSPQDRMMRVQPKIQEYLTLGTSFVWLVDPHERQALIYTPESPGGFPADTLATRNPDVAIELTDLWTALDR